jgi:Carboxypeptidase regulatory-like domain
MPKHANVPLKKTIAACLATALGLAIPLAAFSRPKDSAPTGIHGKVMDTEKVAIEGVHVKAMNEKTKVILIADTNAQGEFELPHLSSGIYDLTFYKNGFEYMLYPHVRINKKQLTTLDVTIHRTSVVQPPKQSS